MKASISTDGLFATSLLLSWADRHGWTPAQIPARDCLLLCRCVAETAAEHGCRARATAELLQTIRAEYFALKQGESYYTGTPIGRRYLAWWKVGGQLWGTRRDSSEQAPAQKESPKRSHA